MKCIVPGTNIKVFGRAIHSLSKIGEELYLEPLDHGLALRTVNSSRSAYACFLFAPSFFQHYDDGAGQLTSQDSEDSLRCKIAMKSILTVFRSLSTMEKTVDRCKIHLNMKDSRLVFQLHCRHGIVKTHNLAFIECETLQAVFSKDMCPNSLTASSKLLSDTVANFQNNQEEITLIVSPEKIILKNYVDDEPDPNKVMHTNLTLDPGEFDNCQVGVDTEVTFCLKELRAILSFSEVTTLPLALHFETAGRPIVFSIDSDSTFEGNFVLATLADQQSQSHAPTPARTQSHRRPINKSKTHSQPGGANSSRHQVNQRGDSNQKIRPSTNLDRSQRLEAAYDEMMNDDDEFEEMMIENNTTLTIPTSTSSGTNRNHVKSVKDKGSNCVSVNNKGDNSRLSRQNKEPVPGCSHDEEGSPVIPVLGTKAKFLDTSLREDNEADAADDDKDDEVPGTPPAKRFRSLFFGSSQASTQATQSSKPPTTSILAEDTDDES